MGGERLTLYHKASHSKTSSPKRPGPWRNGEPAFSDEDCWSQSLSSWTGFEWTASRVVDLLDDCLVVFDHFDG
ncbi:hypothetical protein KC323_g62 [Hortaea werneckii]|nr:hypothetical protein KC323_g62 [Hortaea werneckii]